MKTQQNEMLCFAKKKKATKNQQQQRWNAETSASIVYGAKFNCAENRNSIAAVWQSYSLLWMNKSIALIVNIIIRRSSFWNRMENLIVSLINRTIIVAFECQPDSMEMWFDGMT